MSHINSHPYKYLGLKDDLNQLEMEINIYYSFVMSMEKDLIEREIEADNKNYVTILGIAHTTIYMFLYNFIENTMRKIVACLDQKKVPKKKSKKHLPNIDHRGIKDICSEHSINLTLPEKILKDIHILEEIKNIRNNVGHGVELYSIACNKRTITDARNSIDLVFSYFKNLNEVVFNFKI